MYRHACESEFQIMTNRGLGNGADAIVFEACLKGSNEEMPCHYAIRVQRKPIDWNQERWEELVLIQNKMANAGLAPRILDTWLCDHVHTNLSKLSDSQHTILSTGHLKTQYKQLGPRLKKMKDKQEYIFTLMTKAPGLTLKKWLDEEKMPSAILEGVWKTINVMHKLGIQHNDLHAGNIIVEKNGRVQIVDFDSSWDKGYTLSFEEAAQDRSFVHDDIAFSTYGNRVSNE